LVLVVLVGVSAACTTPTPTDSQQVVQSSPITTPLRATAISANQQSVCALDANNTPWCWGQAGEPENNLSRSYLGFPDTHLGRSTPAHVNLTGVTSLSESGGGCAVMADRTVQCWNRLKGDGTTDLAVYPTPVPGLTNAQQVAIGYRQCVLVEGGQVRCWGGTATTPTPIGIDNAMQLSAGISSMCAILSDATVKCWGMNDRGQLGDGTLVDSETPVTVTGLHDVVSVAVGRNFACGLLTDGTVTCWGRVPSGPFAWSPQPVPDLANAVELAAGVDHLCAVLADTTVKCWGVNRGVGFPYPVPTTPVTVPGIVGAKHIATGLWFSCAIVDDGKVSCWGSNNAGQLGDGTNKDHVAPAPVVGFS
jgi:alpha-tubulin suppressor-like RCC1 family protein